MPLIRRYMVPIITARIRRMTGGYIFSLSTLFGGGVPDPALEGRVPDPALDGGGTPTLDGGYPISGGVPHPMSGGAYPGYPPPTEIASTCYGYAAGGVPLAFTQEDFVIASLTTV